jgi:hypothetical protein
MRTSTDQLRNGLTSATRTLTTDKPRELFGGLPIWIRAPSRGPEFHTGFTRPKLYELAANGYIRTCSVRQPGRIRGTRLFHLGSILAYIDSQCT